MKNILMLTTCMLIGGTSIAMADMHSHSKENTDNTHSEKTMTHAKTASSDFINNKGETIGMVKMTEKHNGVLFFIDLKNLPAGTSAFHIHEASSCTPLDSFKDTGGHYNPTGKEHGFGVKNGVHAGDMPNLYIPETGTIKQEILNTYVTLEGAGANARAPLLDDNGSALILHRGADDYKSQPSGAAGNRIACASIKTK